MPSDAAPDIQELLKQLKFSQDQRWKLLQLLTDQHVEEAKILAKIEKALQPAVEAPAEVAAPVAEVPPEASAEAAPPAVEAASEAPAEVAAPAVEAAPEAPAEAAPPAVEAAPEAPAEVAAPAAEEPKVPSVAPPSGEDNEETQQLPARKEVPRPVSKSPAEAPVAAADEAPADKPKSDAPTPAPSPETPSES